ncbi:uncharacterized protein LOC130614715 isoform X4 [Hydractinia symbiolongicarpus]|nr:uncharacterized protein LOC130614715 isoform X4 [Hydractinia symbiolongicarpus]
MKTVGVVGSGAAGLCAARHLLRSKLKPILFEQQDCVGGTWVYQDVDKNNSKDVFSSMYKNLRTNQPKEIMAFPDFPFPQSDSSYVHHTTVRDYLQLYAHHFNLLHHIRFNTKVTQISPCFMSQKEQRFVKWKIFFSDRSGKVSSEVFDGVVICNGHYSVPSYPCVTGLQHFTGKTMHSHYYRHADEFKDLTTLILGDGPSGSDIMLELSKQCASIYFSHRGNKTQSTLPLNVYEVDDISHVTEDGRFVFKDNNTAEIDVFIPCTGYKYYFPFLDNSSGVKVTGRIVENLYKHLFNIMYPSMAFVGVPWTIIPFPLYHQQCAYVSSIFSGCKRLPSFNEMLKDIEMEKTQRLLCGEPTR